MLIASIKSEPYASIKFQTDIFRVIISKWNATLTAPYRPTSQQYCPLTSWNMICYGWALRSQTKPINTFAATIKSGWRLLLSWMKIWHVYLFNIFACNTAFCHCQLFDCSVNVLRSLHNMIAMQTFQLNSNLIEQIIFNQQLLLVRPHVQCTSYT